MRKITAGKLNKILKEHKRWCENEDEGEKANLSRADLSDANLSEANLSVANLMDADLSHANLIYAYLNNADLEGANLSDAKLSRADLTQVLGLNINQLSKVKTLYEAELDPELMEQVKDEYPHLLEKPKS